MRAKALGWFVFSGIDKEGQFTEAGGTVLRAWRGDRRRHRRDPGGLSEVAGGGVRSGGRGHGQVPGEGCQALAAHKERNGLRFHIEIVFLNGGSCGHPGVDYLFGLIVLGGLHFQGDAVQAGNFVVLTAIPPVERDACF